MGAAAAVAGIGAVAGLAGSYMQSQAVSKGQRAAQAQLAPYNETGQNALMLAGNLSGAYGPDAAQAAMGDFTTSPGYQWRMDQGMRAVDAQQSARGMLRSGATLKAEQEYAQGLASSEFDNYYKRLYGLANIGQNAAGGSANIDLGAAGAQASIYGNTAKGLSEAGNQYYENRYYANGGRNALGPAYPAAYPNAGQWGPTPQYGTLDGKVGTY